MKNSSPYAELTKTQAIAQILKDYNLYDKLPLEECLPALERIFQEGWLRGEEFAQDYYKTK